MKINFARIRRKIYYYGTFMFSKLALLLPYKFSVGGLGAFFGRVAYFLACDDVNIAIKNLKKCFSEKSDKEITKTVKELFCNEARNFFELMNFPRMNSDFINNISNVENGHLIKESLKKGKGILLAGAHTGNWEITAASISNFGVPLNVVAKKIYIDGLNDMLIKYRTCKNINVILREEPDTGRKLFRALKKGEIIAMLIDQDINVPGVFIDFFGYKAWTPSGLAILALKSGADVLVGLDLRIGKYKHKTVIKPVTIEPSEDFDKDVKNLTQKVSLVLEEHIRQYPQQWVWFHERWKTVQKRQNEN